jgi:pyruvate ferredoxin oxidoreductase gamma subunit
MFQVRIHGRGGQGVVTAAELLSVAAFLEGEHAQAFPSFGSERTGAPVAAFCRIDARASRLREPVLNPDALLILDPTLLHLPEVFRGLRPHGAVLVNTALTPSALGLDATASHPDLRVVTLPASDIARRHIGKPRPNGVMLGGFAALTGRVSIDGVMRALRERFAGPIGEGNAAGAREAYDAVTAQIRESEVAAHA